MATDTRKFRLPLHLDRALVLASVLFGISQLASAEEQQISYDMSFAASLPVLEHPDDEMTAMMEAWQTQDDLAAARSRPFMQIVNTSDTAQITHLNMTIGDESFHFESVTLIDAETGIGFAANIIDGGNAFELDLTDFDPGDRLVFQFQIRPDSLNAFQYPDFRMVLFDVNGDGTGDNSDFSVTFTDTETAEEYTLAQQLPDYQVVGPIYSGPTLRSYFEMDKLYVFDLSDQQEIPLIPEPDSILMLVIGAIIAGAALLRGRLQTSNLPPR